MENMTIHDWNAHYDNLDNALAVKYNTTKFTIRFIRVSSLKHNLSHTKTAIEAGRRMYEYKNGMPQWRKVFKFVAALTYDEWMDITRPNTEAIGYML